MRKAKSAYYLSQWREVEKEEILLLKYEKGYLTRPHDSHVRHYKVDSSITAKVALFLCFDH